MAASCSSPDAEPVRSPRPGPYHARSAPIGQDDPTAVASRINCLALLTQGTVLPPRRSPGYDRPSMSRRRRCGRGRSRRGSRCEPGLRGRRCPHLTYPPLRRGSATPRRSPSCSSASSAATSRASSPRPASSRSTPRPEPDLAVQRPQLPPADRARPRRRGREARRAFRHPLPPRPPRRPPALRLRPPDGPRHRVGPEHAVPPRLPGLQRLPPGTLPRRLGRPLRRRLRRARRLCPARPATQPDRRHDPDLADRRPLDLREPPRLHRRPARRPRPTTPATRPVPARPTPCPTASS